MKDLIMFLDAKRSEIAKELKRPRGFWEWLWSIRQRSELAEELEKIEHAMLVDSMQHRTMNRPTEGIIGTPDDGEPVNESEHFEVCPVCKQSFDLRVLTLVIYHDQPEHGPLEQWDARAYYKR